MHPLEKPLCSRLSQARHSESSVRENVDMDPRTKVKKLAPQVQSSSNEATSNESERF